MSTAGHKGRAAGRLPFAAGGGLSVESALFHFSSACVNAPKKHA
eukprot:SAG25_NODE_303_length_10153_cov_13.304356_1_plen_43_part_10